MKQQYDSYKPSGIDWIGDIPSHWNIQRMRFLCDIITGDKDTINREEDGLYPFYVRSPQIERINSYSFDGEAVLMAGDGVGAGKVLHYVNGKFDFHQRVYNFHNFRGIKGRLLYLYLKSLFKYKIEEGGAKNTVDSVRQPWLKDFPICIPPIDEQEAIAAWLDEKCGEIDAAMAKVAREIELLDELKQSVISRAVTRGLNPDAPLRPSGIDWIGEIPSHWKKYRLKFIGDSRNGLTYSTSEIVDSGKLVIRSSNIQNSKLCFDDCVFVKTFPAILSVKSGDTIICSRNGSINLIGKAAYIDKNMDVTFGAFMMRFRPYQHPKFSHYLISTAISQYKGLFSTTTINQLTSDALGKMDAVIPPLAEQAAISDYLDKKCAEIDGLKAKLVKKREILTELRQSIISEVVTGKQKVI